MGSSETIESKMPFRLLIVAIFGWLCGLTDVARQHRFDTGQRGRPSIRHFLESAQIPVCEGDDCLELDCDAEGNILKQHRLRGVPSKPIYHEVWENDEGRTDFASCHKFRRKFRHKLQRPSAQPGKRSRK